MATRVTVVYDGSDESETITLRPLGLVAAERHFGGLVDRSLEATLWAVWYLKGKPNSSFDDWLRTVEAVEEEEVPTRPLDEEPSPEQSQTSPSQRASARKT